MNFQVASCNYITIGRIRFFDVQRKISIFSVDKELKDIFIIQGTFYAGMWFYQNFHDETEDLESSLSRTTMLEPSSVISLDLLPPFTRGFS